MSENLQKIFHEFFEYKDGNLYWKVNRGPKALKGKIAGRIRPNKYVSVKIRELGKEFGLHRVIFCMHYGYIPRMIDHINNDPSDNRIENLRECTDSQNQWNKRINRNNTSGVKNVRKSTRANSFRVELSVHGKYKYIGSFKDFELADLVAHMAREKYHGKFARH